MLAPKGGQSPDEPRDWMSRARTAWTGIAKMLGDLAPKGLYARALIIIIAPIVLLESVVAFEVACALVDKFGGDSLPEMRARYELYLKMAGDR